MVLSKISFSVYGPALLEHTILSVGLKPTAKVPQQFDVNDTDGKFVQINNLTLF